jgi:hypothetical protein
MRDGKMRGTYRRKIAFAGVGIALIAAAAAGYDGNSGSSQAPERRAIRPGGAKQVSQALHPDWFAAQAPILQYQKDPARNRGWVLTPAGAFVIDFKLPRTVMHVPLPDWQWAGEPYGCTPTLVLGPKGEALVSSDVLPALWRIDPDTLIVSRHDLLLDEDSGMDVGFSGLAYAAQQEAYIAVACARGSVWRVDASLRKGQKMSL